jgi:hypothetical protein
LDAYLSQKVHRRHYPLFPENAGNVRYLENRLLQSATILHKTQVNRLSFDNVSNPSLRRKLPALDTPVTNETRFSKRGQSYSEGTEKASKERPRGGRSSKGRSFGERLPAVTAITAVATITTIAAAPSAAATVTASASTATTKAAATATTATRLLRACFVDDQIAAAEVLPVHGVDRAIRFFVIGDFDESKTTRLAREAVTNQIHCGGVDTGLREKIMQRILRCGERKITNIELLH